MLSAATAAVVTSKWSGETRGRMVSFSGGETALERRLHVPCSSLF